MRIEQMNPAEPGRVALFLNPVEGDVNHIVGRPLHKKHVVGVGCVPVIIIVKIETLVEAKSVIEGKGAYEGRCVVSLLFEDLRDEKGFIAQPETGIVADTMMGGIGSGEDIDVGGKGDHIVGKGSLEKNTL